MSNLEKEKKRAKRLSNFQKAVGFVTYFLILGLIIINTRFIMSNHGILYIVPPAPVPPYALAILSLALLSFLILLQTLLVYQLYRVKKEAVKNKNQNQK
ncbi:MAG: hypothetical protein QXS27_05535 [Candidatus Jordarchaeaceae archaeon]